MTLVRPLSRIGHQVKSPAKIVTLAALLIALSACNQSTESVTQGQQAPLSKEQPATAGVADDASQAATASADGAMVVADETPETAEAEEPIQLNLSLPDYDWDDAGDDNPAALQDYHSLPPLFGRPADERVLNWSGKVYLDESEEARQRPVFDTIQGAEVGIQVKTR